MKTQHINEFSNKDFERLAKNGQLIDVRTPEEYADGHIKGAELYPVDQIEQFDKKKDKTYYVYCRSGKRSLKASEYLDKQGYDVVNLDGGYVAYSEGDDNTEVKESTETKVKDNRKQLNYSGLQCPGPIMNLSKEMKQLKPGDQVEATVTDPGFYSDIQSWVKQTGNTLVRINQDDEKVTAIIQKEEPKAMEVSHSANGTTIVLFSGELDKALAALIIANGAKAAGRDVSIFFTFWGLNALKKENPANVKKKGIAKMFDMMLPKTPVKMPLSKMNMFGLGNLMMRYVMKKKNVDSLPALLDKAIEQDIKLIACTMSMDVMGIEKEELRDEVSYGGVGSYIGDTQNASHNLFI
ncbi:MULTISPECIES: DsrE/DsrF/DrsH-like family protein [Staphylococcus]|uniref:DsrE/DsrF/DrsH-like family protein n=1 Tax=Staphylococcus TaxID=1279 RepID=UPI00076434CC|nr:MULTISPECIES: DsrE/DsrF/DrsH-like family protein [Staphylococcus]KXA46422.1 rhodanese-like protein [Staphylococcus simulans]OFM20601.1 dihydroneopterin aldolase [Staphylococcus sp. HMSC059E03]OFN22105.1 dihydroneopterin aldolase [Staphylococcus sp. HMSC055C03]OHR54983.1 dihydroneopterin aldolase [Staphylococcus sp. HMSC070A03]OHR58021.1 dihydroneopterin aldolase [Staphylococcus sp. HMSC070A02]